MSEVKILHDDREKIINAFRVCDQNIDAVVLEPKSGVASFVLISFSAMNQESRYDRWSWFHRRHALGEETLFICFKDDDKLYYLGKEDQPMHVRYKRFISRYLEKFNLNMNSVYAVGSSMGGYAALYYGFLYGFGGVCVTNPQTEYQSARRHEFYNWEKQIRLCGSKFEDLPDFIFRVKGCSRVFIGHSNYPADRVAADNFISALHERKISYMREYSNTGDHSLYAISENKFFNLINYWCCENRI